MQIWDAEQAAGMVRSMEGHRGARRRRSRGTAPTLSNDNLLNIWDDQVVTERFTAGKRR